MGSNKALRRRTQQRQTRTINCACGEALEAVVCPICDAVFPDLEGLALEHAPPSKDRLDIRCLTCESCNGGAVFESNAAEMRRLSGGNWVALNLPVPTDDPTAQRHGETKRTIFRLQQPDVDSGLFRVEASKLASHATVTDPHLTDLKAAFVIAFSILGYRYSAHPSLDAVRKWITERALPKGVMPCVLVPETLPAEHIIDAELGPHRIFLLTAGASHTYDSTKPGKRHAVLLPHPNSGVGSPYDPLMLSMWQSKGTVRGWRDFSQTKAAELPMTFDVCDDCGSFHFGFEVDRCFHTS